MTSNLWIGALRAHVGMKRREDSTRGHSLAVYRRRHPAATIAGVVAVVTAAATAAVLVVVVAGVVGLVEAVVVVVVVLVVVGVGGVVCSSRCRSILFGPRNQ